MKTWSTMVCYSGSPVSWISVQIPRTGTRIHIRGYGIQMLSGVLVEKIRSGSQPHPYFSCLPLTLSELQELFEASKITERHPGCTANSEETDGECPECDALMASRCI